MVKVIVIIICNSLVFLFSSNPDVLIRIGTSEFRYHMLVLQSYSSFFDEKSTRQIELPEVTEQLFSFTKTVFTICWLYMEDA